MEYTINEISIEICRRLNIPLNGKTAGNISIKCINPYHIDKRPSLSISLDKGLYHCFSCGYGGSLKNLYYEKFGRSIYRDLGIKRSLNLYNNEVEKADLSLIPETDFGFEGKWFPMNATDLSKNWMKSRGFNSELMNTLGVKYLKYGRTYKRSDPTNKEHWRFYSEMTMIPIYENRKLLCFEARQLRNEEDYLKYLESKGKDITDKTYKKVLYPKNGSTKTLYRLDYLDTKKPLYVVEGLMDVLSLQTHELFLNSTCTFGNLVKERQYYLLNRFDEIILIPNNDIGGISQLEKWKDKHPNIKVLWLPKQVKDVNDILQKKIPGWTSIQDIVNMGWHKNAKPLSDIGEIEIKSVLKALQLI